MQVRRPGRLYGVGVGPGDPDLITLKAVRVLRRVPAVLVPHSTNRPSVALGIVRRWIRPRQKLILQPYPMLGAEAAIAAAREAAADQAVALLAAGTDLAFVTEGDPLLFSTFIDLLDRTRRTLPDLSIEVVPAVSAVTACAAAAGVPLARRTERLAVLSATDGLDDIEAVLDRFDTVVLLKVRSAYEPLVARLDRLGLTEAAVLVEECGRPDQRITRDLRSRVGQPLSYFATVLVCRTRAVRRASCVSTQGGS
ncbi:precorrin-2 C(20)-methyltransferase [Nitrospira sp. Kam-Ns4a]